MAVKKTIVFYSYKGGTGRSLAVANVAGYLSFYGFRVCIIDMDLEAPGIHYKFSDKHDERLTNLKGVVDYFNYFLMHAKTPDNIEEYLLG